MASYTDAVDSVCITQCAGTVESCEFRVNDSDGILSFVGGQVVKYYDNGALIFAGNIQRVSDKLIGPPDPITGIGKHEWSIKANGYSQIAANHRSGFAVWISTFSQPYTIGDVVSLQLAPILAADGVSANVSPAATFLILDKFQTDDETVFQSLERLRDKAYQLSGVQYFWNITPGKVLNFYPLPTALASATIGTTYGYPVREGHTTVTETREQFANLIVMKTDRGLRDKTTVTLATDGNTSVWNLGTALASEPHITADGKVRTVGLDGIDNETDFEFFWNSGSAVIRQRSGDPTYTGNQVLSVTYLGQDLRVIAVADQASINVTAILEQSSGVHVAVIEAGDASNSSQLYSLARAELINRSTTAYIIRCRVFAPGNAIAVGTLMPVQIAGYGFFGYCFVRQVVTRQIGNQLWRDLELISGPPPFSGVQFMRRLTR